MPDLTKENYYHCESAEHWEKIVPGTHGTYVVRFDNINHNNRDIVDYDYSCTCPAYKFGKGKYCKHIRAVKSERCGWMQFDHGGQPVEVNGEKRCPRCGAPVRITPWAV